MTSQGSRGRWLSLGVLIAIALPIDLGVWSVSGRAQPRAAVAAAAEMLWVDLGELNDVLVQHGYAPLPERLLLTGGMCPDCASEDWRWRWRWGGGALFGRTSSRTEPGDREAALGLDLGGAFLSRPLLSRGRSILQIGLFLGFGRATLELLNRRTDAFADALETPTHLVARRDLFAVEPFAEFEVRLSSRLGVRLQGGYLWTFGGAWRLGPDELGDLTLELRGYSLRLLLTFYLLQPPCRDP